MVFTEYGRRPGGLLALLLLAASPCSGFSPAGARTSRARALAGRSARPACVAPQAAADDSAATLAPRTVATQGYVAPEHLRTWKPFTYASPKERRAAAREFARGLSARQGREPGDMLPALPPIRVALLGGPSCGKGTLAPMISAAFRTRVLGVGQLLRGEIRAESPRASLAADAMAAGALLPDWLVIELLEGRVARSDGVFANGWLLDGFPRTVEQARATLSKEHAQLRPDCVIVIERPDELVKEFALGRMADAATGAIYHPTYAPAPKEVVHRLVWRIDDTPAIVESRLREHKASIMPIIDAYRQAGIPVLELDNARSELETFQLAAAFVEQSAANKLAKMGGREGFRARVFGPASALAGAGGASDPGGVGGVLEGDVAPICWLDETEEECMARYYGGIRAGNAKEGPEGMSAASSAQKVAAGAGAGREEAAAAGKAAAADPAGLGRLPVDPLLEAVRRCNLADRSQYVPVLVDDTTVGWASVGLVEQLGPHIAAGGLGVELVERAAAATGDVGGAAGALDGQGSAGAGSSATGATRSGGVDGNGAGIGTGSSNTALRLAPGVVGLEERTMAVAALIHDLVSDGTIAPGSVRGELQDVWPVAGRPALLADTAEGAPGAQRKQASSGEQAEAADGARGARARRAPVAPVLRMERAAMIHFGIPSYGVHVNGFVAHASAGVARPAAVWIARRSMSKATYPGLFDQMVAGGQPADLSFDENMRKECAEEASLPPNVVASARAAGVVSYCYSTRKGLSTKALAVFDLAMPEDVEPVNADGEVDEFILMPVEEALASVCSQLPLWKPNAALVMIDFAVRHGFITPDEPCYEELVTGLRAGMSTA